MPRRATAAVLVCVALAAGCGEDGPGDEAQVRDVLAEFGRASAARDYRRLCDRVLAPDLVREVRATGYTCPEALEQGLGEVVDPRLTVGRVEVEGDRATAEVRSTAAGQEPSRDRVVLVRVADGWRIADL